jgi:hypothetical protein
VLSTRDLRNEYYRDPALPILLGDEVLKKCLRMGLDQGLFVYKEGDRLEGQGLPPGTLSISEDGKIYTMEKALELSVWPPKTAAPAGEAGVDQPSVFGGDGGTTPAAGGGGETGPTVQVGFGSTSTGGGGSGIAAPAGPGVIERTDNVKTALTQLAQQVSSAGKAIKGLTWRMNSGDGFLPMALLKAEPGPTVRVEMMEGGWSSGDGNAEWSFEFNGTREEATDLRSFIEGQWRRGGEKSLDITYQLRYEPSMRWDDGGEGWIARPHPGWPQRPDRHDPPGTHRCWRGTAMTQAIASGRPAYELRSKQRGPSDLELEVWQVPSTATPELKRAAGASQASAATSCCWWREPCCGA